MIRDYLLKEAVNVAYWISPKGEAVQVGTNHIDIVIKNPKQFGLTSDEIEKTYEKYNEPLGQEGKAREELIIKLVKMGWIRIRRYASSGYSVNVARVNDKKTKDILFDWSVRLTSVGILGTKERDMHMLCTIIGFVDGKEKRVTLREIQMGELYESYETFDINNCITICENIKEVK